MKQDHLTVIDPDLEQKRNRTPEGMAHWAGTGPTGLTCRECSFYEFVGYKSNRGSHRGGTLKNGSCNKYEVLIRRRGPKIPFESAACKYFEPNKTPPAITDPRKP